jgi:hypothetical protein
LLKRVGSLSYFIFFIIVKGINTVLLRLMIDFCHTTAEPCTEMFVKSLMQSEEISCDFYIISIAYCVVTTDVESSEIIHDQAPQHRQKHASLWPWMLSRFPPTM